MAPESGDPRDTLGIILGLLVMLVFGVYLFANFGIGGREDRFGTTRDRTEQPRLPTVMRPTGS